MMWDRDAFKKFIGVVFAGTFSVWLTRRLDATVRAAGPATTSYEVMKIFCMWGICVFFILFWLFAVDRWKSERK